MKRIFNRICLPLVFCWAISAISVAGEIEDKLFTAAANGQTDIVRGLIDKGVDVDAVNSKDGLGSTALLLAATYNHQQVVQLLVYTGADVNIKSTNGVTALIAASINGDIEITRLLLDKGADVNIKTNSGNDALMAASVGGNYDIVQALIDKGANVNASDDQGQNALQFSIANQHSQIAQLLINKGANVNAKSKNGTTPLGLAAERGSIEVTQLLIEKGADVNAKNTQGYTALMVASEKKRREVVDLLTKAGAKSDARLDNLLDAAKNNKTDEVMRLVNEGASLNYMRNGYSALYYACDNNNFTLARWLVDHGAVIDPMSIFVLNNNNHLAKYTDKTQEIFAYLLHTKLSRKGFELPKTDPTSQVNFVNKIKEATIAHLKSKGPWPNDSIGWSLRFYDVLWDENDSESFMIQCDIAVWTKSAMLEIVSKTGLTQSMPSIKNANLMSHVWLFDDNTISTSYNKNRVINGDFKVTRTSSNNYAVQHIGR